jgi:hypothetical protein
MPILAVSLESEKVSCLTEIIGEGTVIPSYFPANAQCCSIIKSEKRNNRECIDNGPEMRVQIRKSNIPGETL